MVSAIRHGGDAAMTLRNVEARLIKLEARRRRPDELLLIWRLPDGDVRAAISGAQFSPGDRVICAEWFDDGPLPAPRWYCDRETRGLESLTRSLERMSKGGQRDPAFGEMPHIAEHSLVFMSDSDLLHAVLGVAT
jgi:hypothetical protein